VKKFLIVFGTALLVGGFFFVAFATEGDPPTPKSLRWGIGAGLGVLVGAYAPLFATLLVSAALYIVPYGLDHPWVVGMQLTAPFLTLGFVSWVIKRCFLWAREEANRRDLKRDETGSYDEDDF
jgi:hypothetical protein